jgi:hypothetical protein
MQRLRQGNNKEPQFTFIPALGGILGHLPVLICRVHFIEQLHVSFLLHGEVLHCMRHIGRLDDQINDSCCLAVQQ